jgi:hypothetical protein
MKTRQEMVYDFMVALASNASVHQEWEEWDHETPLAESYGDHVHGLAAEMADNYLRNL